MLLARNAIQQQLGSVLDIFSTVCNIANVKSPEDFVMDGFDLQDQLMGKQNELHNESFLNHFPHGNHRSNYFTSFIQLDWKVIYHYQIDKKPRYELFSLKEDPFEANNVAESNSKKLEKMIQALVVEMRNKNAQYPEKEWELLELIMPL